MLKDKTEHLKELYDLCNNEEQRSLVKNLLIDFSEMNDEVFNLCLLDMRDTIISKGFPFDECLVEQWRMIIWLTVHKMYCIA